MEKLLLYLWHIKQLFMNKYFFHTILLDESGRMFGFTSYAGTTPRGWEFILMCFYVMHACVLRILWDRILLFPYFLFKTSMLIQSYGAGAGVTAAGVFANIMNIANI